MSLKTEVTKLIEAKSVLENAEKDYEAQRLVVRNGLIEESRNTIDHDGFRIARVDDKIVRRFSIAELREQLQWHYLTDPAIEDIISHSKAESVIKGVLRVTRIPQKNRSAI